MSRGLFSLKPRIDSDGIIHSPSPDVEITKQHLFDFVWDESASKYGDRTALVSANETIRQELQTLLVSSARVRCD